LLGHGIYRDSFELYSGSCEESTIGGAKNRAQVQTAMPNGDYERGIDISISYSEDDQSISKIYEAHPARQENS